MLTARKRNLTLAVFNSNKEGNKKDQPFSNQEYTYTLDTLAGQYPYYVKGKLVDTLNCGEVVCTTSEPNCFISPMILTGLDAILRLCATAPAGAGTLGPVKITFILYSYWFGVATGFNWMCGGPISGMNDNWDWHVRYRITNQFEQFVFMNSVVMSLIQYIFDNAFNLHDPSGAAVVAQLLQDGYSMTRLSPSEYTAAAASIEAAADFNAWEAQYQAWFGTPDISGRNQEAMYIAGLPYTSANGCKFINAASGDAYFSNTDCSGQDISAWAQPTLWTQIRLPNGTLKPYYAHSWGSVSSPSNINGSDLSGIEAAANAFYIPDGAARDADIDELLNGGTGFPGNDTKKSIAEFWAAIGKSVNPPGMMFWFWKQYMTAYDVANKRGNSDFIYSGFHLALGLFEAGRITWDLKHDYHQARPIQEIRRRYNGQRIESWNGTISGENWIPFQPYNFITPPFADFPSGHSAFSQTFANVMNAWFGAIPAHRPIQTLTDLNLLSVAFNGVTQSNPFGTIIFPAGKSQVIGPVGSAGTGPYVPDISGTVPATPITLSWSTWQDIANEAGTSRQYGGIHALSAHQGSQALANALFPIMGTKWGLPNTL